MCEHTTNSVDIHTQANSQIYNTLASWTSVSLLLIALAYFYYRRKFSYWARRGIKSPVPIPWFGTSHYPLMVPKPELELKLHQSLGKMYGLYDGFLGTNPTLVCGHPEAIKQVTIKHFDQFTNRRRPATWKSIRYRALTYMRDEEWKYMRKILAPTFTSNKLKRMFELMKRCTKNLQMSIEHSQQPEIDLKKLFSVFTVDVISTCCFSMDLKDYRHPDSEILISARKFFNVSRIKMAFSMAIPKPLLAMSGFDINDVGSIEFFAKFATEIINKRRKLATQHELIAAKNNNNNNSSSDNNNTTPQQQKYKKHEDFLQILIDAAAEFNGRTTTPTSTSTTTSNEPVAVPEVKSGHQPDATKTGVEPDKAHDLTRKTLFNQEKPDVVQEQQQRPNKPIYSEQQLGDLEILAQSMLFFAVGHETTATLLSSCGLFLALYPELQDRLHSEIEEAFAKDKGDITYDTLMELKYLDAFVSEALRYFTPTLNFDREASDDVEIEVEGQKIVIPKGMGVVIPFHAIHHDPDNFENPENFDPERFMPENKHKIKPCTFIPFGCGPRYCLASRFALIEAKLALSNLVKKFRFVRSEGTIWPPKYRHHYMLLQMEWPKIKFVDRKLESLKNCTTAAVDIMAPSHQVMPEVAA